ncbi:MAG: NUDIX hydrolase [Patescibacteria group bacterium]|nr:NUDIX hydrolase [Patescibacteria group bacterium]
MIKKITRPIAICIFYHHGKILATRGYDESKKQYFYRPIGGGIEFGETSQEALVREIKEELNTEVKGLKKIGLVENIFTYNGQPGHEIVFIYDGQFVDQKFYAQKKIAVMENGVKSTAVWLNISDFPKKNTPLYPVDILSLIDKKIK